MANETFIQGNTLVLSIWDETDSYDPVACLTSNTLTENVEVDEVETKCDPGNIVRTASTYSYELSGEGIYIDEAVDTGKTSHALLKGYLRDKTEITWSLATGLTSPTTEYGTGFLTSVELTGDAGENATFSFTISGTSSITSSDPNAT